MGSDSDEICIGCPVSSYCKLFKNDGLVKQVQDCVTKFGDVCNYVDLMKYPTRSSRILRYRELLENVQKYRDACYVIRVHTAGETELFNSGNCYAFCLMAPVVAQKLKIKYSHKSYLLVPITTSVYEKHQATATDICAIVHNKGIMQYKKGQHVVAVTARLDQIPS